MVSIFTLKNFANRQRKFGASRRNLAILLRNLPSARSVFQKLTSSILVSRMCRRRLKQTHEETAASQLVHPSVAREEKVRSRAYVGVASVCGSSLLPCCLGTIDRRCILVGVGMWCDLPALVTSRDF